MNWTPEPWCISPATPPIRSIQKHSLSIWARSGGLIARGIHRPGSFRSEAEANVRRIVAAVNACQTISTEALEAGVVAELVAACEESLFVSKPLLALTLATGTRYDAAQLRGLIPALEAVIAKAKGQE